MRGLIFCDTEDKTLILETLRAFDKDRTGTFPSRKYDYADNLTSCRTTNLVMAKADIEKFNSLAYTLAFLLAGFGIILSLTNPLTSPFSKAVEIVLYFVSGLCILGVGRLSAWLHILNITLIKKSN